MKILRNTVLGAVAAVGMTAAAVPAQAQMDIVVGAASNVGGMIVFVAQGKGFFAKHGLNATVEIRNTGSALTTSLRAGEIDFVDMRYSNGFTIGWRDGGAREKDTPAPDGDGLLARHAVAGSNE